MGTTEAISLKFKVDDQLTVPQLCVQRGYILKSNKEGKTFTVTGPKDEVWEFEEDEMRTCQTTVESTIQQATGGKTSSLASSKYSAAYIIAVAKKLNFKTGDLVKDVRSAVDHIMAERRRPVEEPTEQKFHDLTDEENPCQGSFVCKNLTQAKIEVLKSIYLDGTVKGNDFHRTSAPFRPYDLEGMEEVCKRIIAAKELGSDVVDGTTTEEEAFVSDLTFFESLCDFKDFNTLRNAADKDASLKPLYQKVVKVSGALGTTAAKTFGKLMPLGKYPALEYLTRLAKIIQNAHKKTFEGITYEEAAAINVFLRQAQVQYEPLAGTLEKSE